MSELNVFSNGFNEKSKNSKTTEIKPNEDEEIFLPRFWTIF